WGLAGCGGTMGRPSPRRRRGSRALRAERGRHDAACPARRTRHRQDAGHRRDVAASLRSRSHLRSGRDGSPGGVVKAEAIRRVVARWGVDAANVIYVGDAQVDMLAAHDAGATSVGAAWAPGVQVADVEIGKTD